MEKMQFKIENGIQLSNLLKVLSELGHSYNPIDMNGHSYPFYIQTWGDKRLTSSQSEFELLDWVLIDTDQFIKNITQPIILYSDNLTVTNGGTASSTTREEFWSDKHYDFNHTSANGDVVKVDPYFVSNQWKLGEKDNSGVLFHILKTIARFGDKNPREREIKAIYAQIKRLAELEGVKL